MSLLLIALIVVAVLIAVASLGPGRQALPGKVKPPPPLPPAQPPALPPATEPNFRRRQKPANFRKRLPTAPPVSKELGTKPKGNGGGVRPKKVHLDFSLPCRVTGRVMLECGCQVCRELRKKFGV
jgi:hypothetical protein